ncbi:short chain enoyl-CoA hydratase [Humitalea rosea]|uniref:Short chain enoyl-CoA hydratase n=1 Tax=Humitalea rosea TaxID=990373 RepID=A0A2W7IY16_9PROT|nr:enoyl-CoA hydratase/isomerase family protein [Humitalea rosea]PZW51085.1 short chain enoyl-CoA hydratase [Humitalea rosea]
MDLTSLRFDLAEGIAVITLDRPPVNAQNRRLREELTWLLDSCSDRKDVRCIVLTGSGATFSAGADIKERIGLAQDAGDYIRHNRLTREFFYAPMDCLKPVICAANGPAIGAGFALMMSCDILLATEGSFVQMPELDVGLAGGAKFLSEHFSRSRSRLMFFTGRRIPAEELYRLGMVEAVVPREALLPTAMQIAREIAAKSPVAMRQAKRSFNVVDSMPYRDAYRFEQTISEELSHTEDAREAQRAFVEKRKPVFKED